MTLRARFRFSWLLLVLAAAAFTLLSSAPAANERGPTPSLEFLGQQIIPTGTQFQGTQFGGLSSIAYDASANVFYVLSDDQSQFDRRASTRCGSTSPTGARPGRRPDPRRDDAARRLAASRSRRSVSTRRGSR